MIVLKIFLYIILGLSIFLPVYTYVIYPLVLKLFRGKKYENGDILPSITAIICFGNGNTEKKVENVEKLNYPNIQIIVTKELNEAINESFGKIIVFLDNETKLCEDALINIVKPFNDRRVDMVVGEQTCKEGNSAFWKYETIIKKMESNIGSVSGANNTFFAVRKKKLFYIPAKIKNVPFYISTKIKQNKGEIVYCSEAKCIEKKNDGNGFRHHIKEASGYWQSFFIFWRMLFPGNGHFVYVSHRVLKWFVFLNIFTFILSLIALFIFFRSPFLYFFTAFIVLILLLFFLACLVELFFRKSHRSQLFKMAIYFMSLNLAYFLALFYWR